ncbi:MAG TPA: hypothetical protein VMW05_07340, partial [Methyloceanibacter sp.]|nr:hypothetical protein [Methyloceanibacter sp.]
PGVRRLNETLRDRWHKGVLIPGAASARLGCAVPLSKEELDGMHQGASVTDQIKDGIRRLEIGWEI